MIKRALHVFLLLAVFVPFGGCTARDRATVRDSATAGRDTALSERIEQLVETVLTVDDGSRKDSAIADASVIFEREGIPTVAKVGDAAAYGFVLINVLGQPPEFRTRFLVKVREAPRHELPEDALTFAEARRRQTEIEDRFSGRTPSHPELRDQIARLYKDDQAVRQKEGFDPVKMDETDRQTAGPLKAIFDKYGVPTYDMVGVQAAKDFVAMVQHQPPAFRLAVLPKLKANVDAGQGEPGSYAMVYDRTQRDQGRNQLYGEQLECASGKALEVAPIDDEANVNIRRAELGLMRLELYARLVRLYSPGICGAVNPGK